MGGYKLKKKNQSLILIFKYSYLKLLIMKLTKLLSAICLLTIFAFTGCQKEPETYFTASTTSTTPDKPILFSNTTADGDHYEWTFGDGSISEEQNPTHSYSTEGSYMVTLTAFSKNGKKSNSTSQIISIGLPPTCLFTFYPQIPNVNETVQFTNNSSSNATSWLWNFGDGSTSTEKNPSHVFSSANSYVVSLTASNKFGNAIQTKTIQVENNYNYSFLAGSYSVVDVANGYTSTYSDNITMSSTNNNKFFTARFANYTNAIVYFTVSSNSINIPSQTVLCGTPPNDVNHTFQGTGNYTNNGGNIKIYITYSDISTFGNYTGCTGTYTKISGKVKTDNSNTKDKSWYLLQQKQKND